MPELIESMLRYIGQTVTIFTTSGGQSGCGFTGTLAAVCGGTVRLITDIGAAPACPIGSSCKGCCDQECCGYGNGGYGYGGYGYGGYGYGGYGGYGYGGYGYGGYGNSPQFDCCYNRCCNNWLGSITEIPVDVTKCTLFVRICLEHFQEFAWNVDLQRSRDKGLYFVKRIRTVA